MQDTNSIQRHQFDEYFLPHRFDIIAQHLGTESGSGWSIITIQSLLPSSKQTWPLSDSTLLEVARRVAGKSDRKFARNLACAFLYYRMGMTERSLAHEFKLTEKSINSLIYRMNAAAKAVGQTTNPDAGREIVKILDTIRLNKLHRKKSLANLN